MTAPRIPRDWTAPLRATGYEPTELHVHHSAPADLDEAPTCPPCRRDHTCHQGRCEVAAQYLRRAQYRSAAERLVARKLAERRHRRADRALLAVAVCAVVLGVMGAT